MTRPFKPLQRTIVCGQLAEMLSKYLDSFFLDVKPKEDQNCTKTSTSTDQLPSLSTTKSMNEINNIDYDMMVKNLQADILRRAMEGAQEDLESIAEERRNYFARITNQSMSDPSRMPRLPEEVISRIFTMVYESEDDRQFGRQTTIHRFIRDAGTPDEWKWIAGKALPIVVADVTNANLQNSLRTIDYAVGPHPVVLNPHELDNADEIPPLTSVLVLINKNGWPTDEHMEFLELVRWNHLVVHHDSRGDQDQQDFILDLFQKPRVLRKLVDVKHLDVPVTTYNFYVVNPLAMDGINLGLVSKTLEVEDETAFNVRTAILPLPLLTSLRPMLSRLIELKVSIQPFVTNFNLTVDALRPLSMTLRKLILWGPSEYWPRGTPAQPLLPVRQEITVSFPELKSLEFHRISERTCRDMLRIFHCPVLEELDVADTKTSEARYGEIYDSTLYVSIDFLHEVVPHLKCLHVNINNTQDGLLMLTHLAKRDASDQWSLPNLEAIVLDSVRNSVLTTLTEIVINRLNESQSTPISPIRSVTLPGFAQHYKGTLQEAYLSTLNLFVAEVKIPESYYDFNNRFPMYNM